MLFHELSVGFEMVDLISNDLRLRKIVLLIKPSSCVFSMMVLLSYDASLSEIAVSKPDVLHQLNLIVIATIFFFEIENSKYLIIETQSFG